MIPAANTGIVITNNQAVINTEKVFTSIIIGSAGALSRTPKEDKIFLKEKVQG